MVNFMGSCLVFTEGCSNRVCTEVKQAVPEVIERFSSQLMFFFQIIMYHSYSVWRSQVTQSMMLRPIFRAEPSRDCALLTYL